MTFDQQNELLQELYIAICNGQEVFQCSRGAFALPAPQKTGTAIQQHSYAVQKAREVYREITSTK